jgi:diphthamide biosynthesis methyltransferase
MAFYLIGTGMNRKSISADALETLKSCDKVYLENYTVNFPYPISELEELFEVKIIELARGAVEDESILEEAKNSNVA